MRSVAVLIISILLSGGLTSPLAAQGGGKPVDSKAIAELERAEKLYAEEEKLQEALKLALAQVESFQRSEDFDHLVNCLFLIGNVYFDLGQWDKAEQFMQQANDLGWLKFPEQMGTGALKIIGEAQFMQDKPEAALKTYEQRVQKIKQQGGELDQSELAGALFDAAGMQLNLLQSDAAFTLLEEAAKANAAHAAWLAKPDSAAQADDRDANALDRAEITYHQAIARFQQQRFPACRELLEQALEAFDAVQSGKRTDVRDRLVAVLDDLVLCCEKLNDLPAAERYRGRRDKLNQ